MRKIIFISLFILALITVSIAIYYSKNEKSNQTSVGFFWYNWPTDEKYATYQSQIKYNDKLLIHIIVFKSKDKAVYQYGNAVLENNTLKLEIQEITKFHFSKEVKRTMTLYPTNFCFLCDVFPKNITIQIDDYGPFPLDSFPIRAFD